MNSIFIVWNTERINNYKATKSQQRVQTNFALIPYARSKGFSNEKISSLFQDPDLLFLVPLPDSKSSVNQYFNDWMSFIESSPFGDFSDWLSKINYENADSRTCRKP